MGGHHSTSRRSGLHARNSTRRRFGLAVGRRSVDQDRLEGLASSRELDHVNDQPSGRVVRLLRARVQDWS